MSLSISLSLQVRPKTLLSVYLSRSAAPSPSRSPHLSLDLSVPLQQRRIVSSNGASSPASSSPLLSAASSPRPSPRPWPFPEKQKVVIEKVVRNKHKCVTIVKGLEIFGVKLSEAEKNSQEWVFALDILTYYCTWYHKGRGPSLTLRTSIFSIRWIYVEM